MELVSLENRTTQDSPMLMVENGATSNDFANIAMQLVTVKKIVDKRTPDASAFLEKYSSLPHMEQLSSDEDDRDHRYDLAYQYNFIDNDNHFICSKILDPFGRNHIIWLFVVSLVVLYNYWTIILRIAFVEGQGKTYKVFLVFDYLTDIILLGDIWVQARTGYINNGLLVKNLKEIRRHYMKSAAFVLDCVAVIPFDFLFIVYGIKPFFRIGRLLKLQRFLSFNQRIEVITNQHNMFSLALLIHYVFLIIHWVACAYFLISKSVGYGSEPWVYPAMEGEWAQITRQYLYCFYVSSVTMTYVGNVPSPKTPKTFLTVVIMYLIGVLVFAMIVGGACDMITSLALKRADFNRKINEIKNYMVAHHVPDHLQERVVKWFDYVWMENIDMNDENTFEFLPDKCKAELLLHVNLNTLRKVEIFEDCEPSFLRELVLCMQPTQCCPGDYICTQGEVGNAMFIVNKGHVEVEVDNTVVATLSPGNHFGEISILGIKNVGNRRTASIRSVGFSELFKLPKQRLQEVLKDYPYTKKQMETKSNYLLKKDHERRKPLSQDWTYCPDPTEWLKVDRQTLHDQIQKVEKQLKEKKLQFLREKVKRQEERRVTRLIGNFVKRNPCREDAREFVQNVTRT